MSVPDVRVPTVRLYHSRCVALMCVNEPETVGIANRSIHYVCLHEYTALKSPNIGRNGLSGRLQFSRCQCLQVWEVCVCACASAAFSHPTYTDVVYTSKCVCLGTCKLNHHLVPFTIA